MVILQQCINGLALGAIYALIALGYTMVYGVMKLINFAHGDIYMLGAYAGMFAAGWLGVTAVINADGQPAWWLVIGIFVLAMAACALAGMLIERCAYRPLRHQPRLAALITAIGVSLLLEYGGQAVFSPAPRSFPALIPDIALINTGNFRLSLVQVVIVAVAILLMVGLEFIIKRTKIGSAMRAVSMDQTAAVLMGINVNRVIAFTFAIGSALAGAGGVLNSIYTPKIDPLMGLMVGLKAFVAAVLGGIGSVPGAVLGGLLMGFAETGVVAVGKSEYRDAIAFSILIIVLLWRPSGILGKSTTEKV